MSLTVAPNERGVVRVFALSMTDGEAKTLRKNTPYNQSGMTPQQAALGASFLDPDFVEVFPVKDLADLGLVGYLETGNEIDPDQLAPDKPKLNALEGWVLIAYSAAFGGVAQPLAPGIALKLIGTYSEPLTDWSARPVEAVESAKPFSGAAQLRPTPDATARSFRLGRIVVGVLVLLVAIIWLIVR
jgi:hypothetical protein